MNPLMNMAMQGMPGPSGAGGNIRNMNAPGSSQTFWPKSTAIQIPASAHVWQGGGVDSNKVLGGNAATGDYPGNGVDALQGMSTQNPQEEYLRQMLQHHLTAGLGTLPRRDHLFRDRTVALPAESQTTGGAQSGSGGWA